MEISSQKGFWADLLLTSKNQLSIMSTVIYKHKKQYNDLPPTRNDGSDHYNWRPSSCGRNMHFICEYDCLEHR